MVSSVWRSSVEARRGSIRVRTAHCFRQVVAVVQNTRPDVIINTAAYTAVDRAESDAERAFAVNATGAGNVASAAASVGARVIQLSTDYVFGGDRASPYPVAAQRRPLN